MIFKFFLFDLDNCLIHYPNTSDFIDTILVETLKKFSVLPPKRKVRVEFWNFGKECDFILNKWGISDIQEFWRVFEKIDLDYRKLLIEKKEIYLFEDVNRILTQLKKSNKKLALISNSPKSIVDYVVKKFNLLRFFNEILSINYENNINLAKPSPDGILNVLNKLHYNAKDSKALMIGDSIIDVIAAKRANIYVCLVIRDEKKKSNEYKDWEHIPDFTISKLDEILKL